MKVVSEASQILDYKLSSHVMPWKHSTSVILRRYGHNEIDIITYLMQVSIILVSLLQVTDVSISQLACNGSFQTLVARTCSGLTDGGTYIKLVIN